MENKNSKKGQEEIVGFALILIIVAIILLVFLALSLRSPQKASVESYEVESFIQSFLQYTTDCSDNFGRMDSENLIASCNENVRCADGKLSCDVLNEIAKGIAGESWKIGTDRPIKGYDFNITSSTKDILTLKEGTKTQNLRGAGYPFLRGD